MLSSQSYRFLQQRVTKAHRTVVVFTTFYFLRNLQVGTIS